MNVSQKNHLVKRIREIALQKKLQVVADHGRPDRDIIRETLKSVKIDIMTISEIRKSYKEEIIKRGSVPRYPIIGIVRNNREVDNAISIAKEKARTEIADRQASVDERVAELIDEVMIGDCTNAMEMLSAFIKEEF